MSLYSPSLCDGIESPEEFLAIYGAIYDYLNRNQALESKIDALLQMGMPQADTDEFTESRAEIIYWKVGGTHPVDLSRPSEGDWKIRYQYGEIDVNEVADKARKIVSTPEDDALLRNSLLGFASVRHMGPVYSITIAHFLSQGRLPIYDKFAHIAMLSICGQGLAGRKASDCYYSDRYINRYSPASSSAIDTIVNRYSAYVSLAQRVYGLLEKGGVTDDRFSRRVDKALWAYGHLFSESKATSGKLRIE